MTFDDFPQSAQTALEWTWDKYQPYVDDLLARPIDASTVESWLADWTKLRELSGEVYSRLYVATTVNTADEKSKQQFFTFLENAAEQLETANEQLNRKLLDSGVQPEGFEIPLRAIQEDVKLFRQENIPLKTELEKLTQRYSEIAGKQTINWHGEDKTLDQMKVMLMESDRTQREQAWHAVYDRILQDRDAFNQLWGELLDLRLQLAANADKSTFRDYQWMAFGRYDYTPDDDLRFLDSIEEVVVPAMLRRLEKRKQYLGLDSLRPWDMDIDTTGDAPLKPFGDAQALIDGGARIFEQVNPQLSAYYNTMRDNNLLDLDNRPNKAPGGYCIKYAMTGNSFIFMNSVGIHDNVQTLLHEAGHAFHNFESAALPYVQQRQYPTEFAEVASMAMELLALPYVAKDKGGFYDATGTARAWVEHLDGLIRFWPYMAVVDAFQHWVYTNPDAARDTANCDETWGNLWDRFMPGVDWTGLEETKKTGWHRKLHIFLLPFYYIEYGLAQLGAVQVWRNALNQPEQTLQQYRDALALGNTRTLPGLYEAAGAKLAFDATTLGDAVTLIEQKLDEYEAQIG